MSNANTVKRAVWLKLLSDRAKAAFDQVRAGLADEARGEYQRTGVLPTGRLPGLARVSSSVSHAAIVVDDSEKFVDWVKANYPDALRTYVHVSAAWQERYLAGLTPAPDENGPGPVMDPETGAVVPGLRYKPGGEFLGVSVTPEPGVRREMATLLDAAMAHLAIESGVTEPAEAADAP